MVGVEGIGEAVTGGMVAHAVEPGHGEAGEPEGNCLNCGAELAGAYCHVCGQKGHVHRTLRGFWHELVHGVFHFEGKIWRTLPLLAWRPGELTRRYVAGERASFVSPIALFLFSVFLMFAVFSLIGGPFTANPGTTGDAGAREEAMADFREEQAGRRAELAELRAEQRELAAAGRPTVEIDRRILSLESSIALSERIFEQTITALGAAPAEPPQGKAASGGRAAENAQAAGPQTNQTATAEDARPPGPRIDPSAPAIEGDLEVPPALRWLNRSWEKARENPQLLAYKLQTNAYKFSWALIPISVPFLWMLFLHRRRYRQYKAYDHTVFVTYSIAFMSLALIALSVLRPIGFPEGLALTLITFIPPFHMYRQLRGAYALSRWSAIWRTFVLLIFAFIAATLFFLLLLGIGALG